MSNRPCRGVSANPVTFFTDSGALDEAGLAEEALSIAAGKYMIAEVRRGAFGTMPACGVTDVPVAVWNAYEAGDEPAAREVFNRLLPLLNFESLWGVNAYKEVLRQRGRHSVRLSPGVCGGWTGCHPVGPVGSLCG